MLVSTASAKAWGLSACSPVSPRPLRTLSAPPALWKAPVRASCTSTAAFPTRDFILAMGFDNLGYTQAVREYESRNVIDCDRLASSIYSKRMLDSFGMDGAIRVSPLHCNSVEEIDKFLGVTQELAAL